MYQFTDTGTGTSNPVYPLSVTFDGTVWESVLNNSNGSFRVIYVDGRGVLGENHATTSVPGRNGQYYHSKTIEERTLTIKAFISGYSDLAFRKQYELFNRLLHTNEPKAMSFADETDRVYFAKFKSASIPDEVVNHAVATLTFVCYDPFKYSDIRSVSTKAVTYNGDYETKPKITITLTAGGSEFRLLHVEKQLYVRIKGIYQAGNVIEIDMAKRTIKQNGRSILSDLDMVNSRFFSFSKGKNTLSTSLGATTVSEFREVFA